MVKYKIDVYGTHTLTALYEVWLWSSCNYFIASIPGYLQLTKRL